MDCIAPRGAPITEVAGFGLRLVGDDSQSGGGCESLKAVKYDASEAKQEPTEVIGENPIFPLKKPSVMSDG